MTDVIARLRALSGAAPLDVAALRSALPELTRAEAVVEVGSVEPAEVLGPELPVRVQVYRPAGRASGQPTSTVVYAHGGGWVAGNVESADHACRLLCHGLGAVVVSVDYRLAPDDPFPAAFDDCYAVVKWAADEPSAVGGDAGRLVVAGEGAGANLAAGLAVVCRDFGPPVAAQLLLSPIVDSGGRGADDRVNGWYPSRAADAGALPTMSALRACWAAYLPDVTWDVDARVSAICVDELAGLPPAVIHTVAGDPLVDEGDELARVLAGAGVAVVHRRVEGAVHGFFELSGAVPDFAHAAAQAVADLRELLAQDSSATGAGAASRVST